MKVFLDKMNVRLDILVNQLKKADSMVSQQKDHQAIMEQIRLKKINSSTMNTSIAKIFKEKNQKTS